MSETMTMCRAVRRLLALSVLVVAACTDAEDVPDTADTSGYPPLRAVYDTESHGYFIDPLGREVRLRGVNVNSYAEYWQFAATYPTVTPFTEVDMDFLASMGYNVVRLLVTWSRVEPEPGAYDIEYLEQVRAVIRGLWQRGIYTLIDMHQDAWGPHLAARPDEACVEDERPAGGWDGAPLWATLVDPATPRCLPNLAGRYLRELSPAVREAWMAFFANQAGPGGIGLQDRFAAMWGEVAARLGAEPGVMGYDILNEPNALFEKQEFEGLRAMYIRVLAEVRRRETEAGIAPRIFLFEPSGNWANVPAGSTVSAFSTDSQLAYGPHIYQGSIGLMPLGAGQVSRLRDELYDYGGIPVLCGEWGAGPDDAELADGYFARMLELQDAEGWSMAHWVYQAACGDPHSYGSYQEGNPIDGNWGYRRSQCDNLDVQNWQAYEALIDRLRRPAMMYAPGRIENFVWSPDTPALEASGSTATDGAELELFLPGPWQDMAFDTQGLSGFARTEIYGGVRLRARATGTTWSLRSR